MDERKNYEDKLDRILDETSAKTKDKPQIELQQSSEKKGKSLYVVVLIVVVLLAGIISFVFIRSGKKSDKKEKTTKVIEMIQLKKLSGLTVEQAENILKEDNISIVVDDYMESEEYEKDQIVSQTPNAGQIEKGTKVHVVLSKGSQLIVIPKVTGMKEKSAIKKLEHLGLLVDIRYEYDSDVKKGRVTNMSVAAGTKAPKGSEIQLVISKGKEKVEQTVIPDNSAQVSNGSASINNSEIPVVTEKETTIEKKAKVKKDKTEKGNNPQIIEVID